MLLNDKTNCTPWFGMKVIKGQMASPSPSLRHGSSQQRKKGYSYGGGHYAGREASSTRLPPSTYQLPVLATKWTGISYQLRAISPFPKIEQSWCWTLKIEITVLSDTIPYTLLQGLRQLDVTSASFYSGIVFLHCQKQCK